MRTSIKIAAYDSANSLNDMEPAAGFAQHKIPSSPHCTDCSTFSFFDEYRRKARIKARQEEADLRHAAIKKHIQQQKQKQKQVLHFTPSEHPSHARYNPIRHRVITDSTSYTTSSTNYER